MDTFSVGGFTCLLLNYIIHVLPYSHAHLIHVTLTCNKLSFQTMKKLLCLGVFAFIFLFFYREEESGVRSEVNSNISQC